MNNPDQPFPSLRCTALLLLVTVMATITAACLDRPATKACDDGACPAGWYCGEQGDCVPGDCGDTIVDPGEVCDDGDNSSGDGCSQDCRSDETCGNGIIDAVRGEVCDDGDNSSGDDCSADCRSKEICGNSIIDAARGEVCDDGNEISGDDCSADCRSKEICGNSIIDRIRGEVCDDGNTDNGDGCPGNCRYDCRLDEAMAYWVCRDKLSWHQARDVCQRYGGDLVIIDDAMENSRVGGLLPGRFWIGLSDMGQEGAFRWVDGIGVSYEAWIPGEPNNVGGENCVEVNFMVGGGWNDDRCDEEHPFVCDSSVCTDCHCGNGRIEPGEECDDGNTAPGDGCDTACRIEPECGNGRIEPGEECDDGNTTPGDDCDAACMFEYVREMEPNEDGTPEISGSFEGNDFSPVNANGPYEADAIIAATLEPAGDEDVFAVSNRGPDAVRVRFETHDLALGLGLPCEQIDTVLFIRDEQGNVLAFNDDVNGLCSTVDRVILPGETVYAHMVEYTDSNLILAPGYALTIDFQ